MNLFDIILLAFALGIDCLVVSFSQGLIFTKNRIKNSLFLAFTMGLFQGFMPCIGFAGADYVYNLVQPFSKWLVFVIFILLGFKFILESYSVKEQKIMCIGFKCLLGLGIATSIDALVAGAGLNFTHAPILLSVFIIGFVSFIMSFVGFWSGNLLKTFPSQYLEISGGCILIFLAFKSLIF